jgi:hypothetical protein
VQRQNISPGNSANSGLIAGFREISVRTRMRGGAGRTRTCKQEIMSLPFSRRFKRIARVHIGYTMRDQSMLSLVTWSKDLIIWWAHKDSNLGPAD